MLLPLVVFLRGAVLPVFFGRLRSAPFWVSVQALALAWAVGAPSRITMHSLIGVIEYCWCALRWPHGCCGE
jgi:hypothetical protein